MKKWFFSLTAALILCIAMLSTSALAANSGTYGKNVTWKFDTATGTLTVSGKGDMNGDPLSSGSWCANVPLEKINAIVIEEGITSIGNNAFAYINFRTGGSSYESKSKALTVSLPSTLKSIGDGAFQQLGGLQSINIPQGVIKIGDSAFSQCSSLTSVDLPDGVTSLGYRCFSNCTSLTSVDLPDHLVVLQGFDGCALTHVDIPSTVKEIINDAFRNCKLSSVDLPDGLTTIGSNAFSGSTFTSIDIPESVTSIGESAFSGCSNLTSVVIPDAVTSIGNAAFGGCTSLKSITLGKGITSIGDRAFYQCTALTSLVLPEGVTRIGEYCFNKCTALTSIVIPKSTTHLGNHAFRECSSLTSAVIHPGITVLNKYTFRGCSKLTSITLPASLKNFEYQSLYLCKKLTDVYYEGTEAQWKVITRNEGNTVLDKATIHYNSPMPGSTKPAEITFSDVADNIWYHDAVIVSARVGIITGSGGSTFTPKGKLTWAHTVTFAVRLHQYLAGEHIYGPSDHTGTWYDIYVQYALERGLIEKASSNPNATITRGEAIYIFSQAASYNRINDVPVGYFTDVPSNSPYYDAIYSLAESGYCNGVGNHKFDLYGTFTRAEAATIAARIAGLVPAVKLNP